MSIKARDIHENCALQQLTPGGEVYEGGTSKTFKTGDWRVNVPVYAADKCKQCLLCAPYCPDGAIPVKDGKRTDFDFDHCKGCGICAKVCPFKTIEMKKEEEK